MAMVITRAPAPTLACIKGITGKGHGGKVVVILITVVISRGVKTNIN
jgi:hypothetical protein